MASDDDLEPVHDHTARNAALVLGALALGGLGAWAVHARIDDERRGRELQRAADAWSDLSRCVAGERYRVGDVARTARRAWLRVTPATRALPPEARAREWPWRCAAYANTLTHALFESRSDDPRHRVLNQFASQAATDLARAALHAGRDDTRRYLDELFAAAARAALPPGRPSAVALPPEPMRVLDPARVAPLFRGAGGAHLVAEEPLDAGALRAVLGRTERRLCDFDRALDAPECQRVPALDAPAVVALSSTRYPRMPGYLVGPVGYGRELRHPARPGEVAFGTAFAAHREDADHWVTVEPAHLPSDVPRMAQMHLRVIGTPLRLPDDAGYPYRNSGHPHLLGEVLITASPTDPSPPAAPDAGVADAGVADAGDAGDAGETLREVNLSAGVWASAPARWRAPLAPVGSVRAAGDPVVRGCRLGDDVVAAVYGDDGRARVLWWRGDRWLEPVTTEGAPGSFTCDEGRARMAWYATRPMASVHVTTCTPGRCTHASAPAPFTETAPRVAALGDAVLMTYTRDGGASLAYRFGPLAGITDGRETVVFDDAAHEGADFESPPTLLARGSLAVILATRRDGARETWAVRVDARGFRALRARE